MGAQALVQLIGVAATLAWSALATLLILFVTKATCGLRVTDEQIEEGLDSSAHGEQAYNP